MRFACQRWLEKSWDNQRNEFVATLETISVAKDRHIPNKHKQAISVMENQEEAQHIPYISPLKLNNLLSFKQKLSLKLCM